jgi:hypothetical protein
MNQWMDTILVIIQKSKTFFLIKTTGFENIYDLKYTLNNCLNIWFDNHLNIWFDNC